MVDSLLLNSEKYKSCLTDAAGKLTLSFWPAHIHTYTHKYIYTSLMAVHSLNRGKTIKRGLF